MITYQLRTNIVYQTNIKDVANKEKNIITDGYTNQEILYNKEDNFQTLKQDIVILDDKNSGKLIITPCSFSDRNAFQMLIGKITTELKNKFINIQSEAVNLLITYPEFTDFVYTKLFDRCAINGMKLKYPDTFDDELREKEYLEIMGQVIQNNLPLYARQKPSINNAPPVK